MEGKLQSTKTSTPTTPPRPRRSKAPYLHAGAQIWGFPILPPPERPAEGEKSPDTPAAAGRSRVASAFASEHCR